jgi:hypothetical protein
MKFDIKSPKGGMIWSGVWALFSIFNLDIAWSNLQRHRSGFHGLFTDKARFIFWLIMLVFFLCYAVRNGLRWRQMERAQKVV